MTRTPQTSEATVPPTASLPASAGPRGAAGMSPPAFSSQESPHAGGDPQAPPGVGRRRAAGAAPGGLQAIAAAMPEDRGRDSLDARIRRLTDDLGLLRYHTHDSRRSPGGFPDLVCVGPGGVLYRELKRQGKNPTPAQQQWLDTLAAAGADADVWRPMDLLSGRVARELAAISGWTRGRA